MDTSRTISKAFRGTAYYEYIKRKNDTNVRASAVYERRWFKDADLILVSRSYLSGVCAAIQTTDSNVVVYRSRDYLHSFKVVGQNDDITASGVCLNETKDSCQWHSRRGVNASIQVSFSDQQIS